MKIVYIVPGSGATFYCDNCLRDTAAAQSLRKLGHDVVLVPMYLPLLTDDPAVSRDVPVFFGGINAYLQQKIGLFRITPRWVDRLFDARWLLKLAARKAGSTRASGLGDMTLSMLRGEAGHQAKELDRLVAWLAAEGKPDVVHISNALLVGLAGRIRKELGCAVVCALQNEDTWLDAMDPDDSRQCWEAIAARAADVDAFAAVSRYYADTMRRRLRLAEDHVRVVHIGIETADYQEASLTMAPPVIGYLSRMAESLGLGILFDAFVELKRKDRWKALQFKAAGGGTDDDKRFLRSLRLRADELGVGSDVEFVDALDRDSRLRFLQSLSVLSVPVPHGEAFGTYILEALAAGVPVVQPRAGAFPELIESTGGGILYEPELAGGLVAAIESVLGDPARARDMARHGRAAVRQDFSVERMAENFLKVYEYATNRFRRSAAQPRA
jgi:glycosyltransferase involved in cell wall biosynthesis